MAATKRPTKCSPARRRTRIWRRLHWNSRGPPTASRRRTPPLITRKGCACGPSPAPAAGERSQRPFVCCISRCWPQPWRRTPRRRSPSTGTKPAPAPGSATPSALARLSTCWRFPATAPRRPRWASTCSTAAAATMANAGCGRPRGPAMRWPGWDWPSCMRNEPGAAATNSGALGCRRWRASF